MITHILTLLPYFSVPFHNKNSFDVYYTFSHAPRLIHNKILSGLIKIYIMNPITSHFLTSSTVTTLGPATITSPSTIIIASWPLSLLLPWPLEPFPHSYSFKNLIRSYDFPVVKASPHTWNNIQNPDKAQNNIAPGFISEIIYHSLLQ